MNVPLLSYYRQILFFSSIAQFTIWSFFLGVGKDTKRRKFEHIEPKRLSSTSRRSQSDFSPLPSHFFFSHRPRNLFLTDETSLLLRKRPAIKICMPSFRRCLSPGFDSRLDQRKPCEILSPFFAESRWISYKTFLDRRSLETLQFIRPSI